MRKSNITGNRLSSNGTIIAFLTGVSKGWDETHATMETVSSVMSEATLSSEFTKTMIAYTDAARRVGLMGASFVEQTMTSLQKQRCMDRESAEQNFTSLHDVILMKIAGINEVHDTAAVQLRTLLGLLILSEVPTKLVAPLMVLAEYKAKQLGIFDKDWITGPINGLKDHAFAVSSNGHAAGMIGDEMHPVETGGAEVSGEGGMLAS